MLADLWSKGNHVKPVFLIAHNVLENGDTKNIKNVSFILNNHNNVQLLNLMCKLAAILFKTKIKSSYVLLIAG